MQRIAIIGPCGAGKSTLSMEMGKRTGLPVYHLDALYWKPGWVESEREEFVARQQEVLLKGEWIIDGNFLATIELRARTVDTIIFLDFPRRRYFPRIFKRVIRYYGKTRPDMGEGCNERFDWEFIQYVWNFDKNSRHRIIETLDQYRERFALHVLKSPKEVKQFLSSLELVG